MTNLNSAPIFSIVLPSKDRPDLLKRAIQSALNQTFNSYEIIVIDDASINDNKSIVQDFNSSRISYLENEENQGVSFSRNLGIMKAKGKYISFLDDDDEYLPGFLESTYSLLENTSDDIGFSWSSVRHEYVSEAGTIKEIREKVYPAKYKNINELFGDASVIGLSYGVTIKAACLQKVGLFDINIKSGEDSDLFLRIMSNGFKPVTNPEILINLYHYPSGSLSKQLQYMLDEKICEKMIERYKSFLNKFPLVNSRYYGQNAHIHFLCNKRKQANSILLKLIRSQPLKLESWHYALMIKLNYNQGLFKNYQQPPVN